MAKIAEELGIEGNYQGYQSENEVFLAVAQGKADAGITTNTTVLPITQQFDTGYRWSTYAMGH
jgi:polar amino acid transport system substrate-binding protein